MFSGLSGRAVWPSVWTDHSEAMPANTRPVSSPVLPESGRREARSDRLRQSRYHHRRPARPRTQARPHDGEKDRLIGQCCKYSVEWVTWAVVLGMSRKNARKLVNLLQQKSLHYIEVIEFDLTEADDEDDGDEN